MSRIARSVAMAYAVHDAACSHLLRFSGHREDLCFALWRPSRARSRMSALIERLLLPEDGDRDLHPGGNASFQPRYFERVAREAAQRGTGIAFLHSHLGPGWQGMSTDDVAAELGHAAPAYGATGLPLLGLTLGTDGAWSARFWERTGPRAYTRHWCGSVRVVGERLAVTWMDSLAPPPQPRDELSRTISAWGQRAQESISRLRIGVVGLGTVGSIVAESLARTGIEDVIGIDFDYVEKINLDRILNTTSADIGRPKVEVAAERVPPHATAEHFNFEPIAASVAEEAGFRAALDCDLLFSCVDRPWGRQVLNFIAYAHLIPVIDGGISVRRTRRGAMLSADWRAHVAAPDRRCLECLRQFDPGLVAVEREGLLDDRGYIERLPADHPVRRNENVFAFSVSAAGMQLMQMVSLVVAPMGISDIGAQLYHAVQGRLDRPMYGPCDAHCPYPGLIAAGDAAPYVVTGPRPVPAPRV